jgi:hypothetical protein
MCIFALQSRISQDNLYSFQVGSSGTARRLRRHELCQVLGCCVDIKTHTLVLSEGYTGSGKSSVTKRCMGEVDMMMRLRNRGMSETG